MGGGGAGRGLSIRGGELLALTGRDGSVVRIDLREVDRPTDLADAVKGRLDRRGDTACRRVRHGGPSILGVVLRSPRVYGSAVGAFGGCSVEWACQCPRRLKTMAAEPTNLPDAPDIIDGYHEAGWRGLTGQNLRKTRCGSSAIG